MATPLKVLIVEDSPDDAELMVAQLRRAGLEFVWERVETEADFLAELKKLPDIILSDYSLPQFTGLRAVELLRASGLNLPLILISGTMGEEAAVEAMRRGATDYLLKDRIARLGNAVERALEQQRLREERQHTQEELLWKTTVLEAQLESSLDGILVVDTLGKVILQNRRMAEIWKIPLTGDAGKAEAAHAVFDPSQEKHPRQFIEKVAYLYAHPDEASHDVIELIDGTVLDRYSAPVKDKAGKNYGRIWSFRDITERRKLEAQFRQSQKMESIGQLAGGIAHDFNNILAAMVGNIYLAKLEVAENPAAIGYLENISRSTARATDLVSQILTFSRQTKPERVPLKLNLAVAEALKFLRASVPSTIQIETELIETPAVLANATAIHQVIMNLGTNAWHAMRAQPGTLKIEMKVVELDADFAATHADLRAGRHVVLTVSDTGCGMSRAVLERIFDPFFTTKPVGEGTGLGLSVVHGIMKSHDGGILVYSQPGQGTVFHLYFPVLDTGETVTESESAPLPRGAGERILIVDDEADLAGIIERMLEVLGYQVRMTTRPEQALAALREHPESFDLVLTDFTMPGMDGVKLGEEILKIRPGLPLILMTGYSGVMTTERIRGLGFRAILNKPCTMQNLADTVHHALRPTPATNPKNQT